MQQFKEYLGHRRRFIDQFYGMCQWDGDLQELSPGMSVVVGAIFLILLYLADLVLAGAISDTHTPIYLASTACPTAAFPCVATPPNPASLAISLPKQYLWAYLSLNQ